MTWMQTRHGGTRRARWRRRGRAGASRGRADEFGGILVGDVLDALLGLEVELAPDALARRVDDRVGVAAEAVEVAIGRGDAAVGEEDRDLVERFGAERPEVPLHVHVAEVGLRVALLGVDEHLELVGIADEEDGRVVADEIPVALVGVELDGEAAHVALGVGGAALAGDGGEAEEGSRSSCRASKRCAARVYLVMSPVTVNVPYAPEPLACTTRSGMRSRLKCCICSMRATSCMRSGPRGPAVRACWTPMGRAVGGGEDCRGVQRGSSRRSTAS
jgi:hypothetical protein